MISYSDLIGYLGVCIINTFNNIAYGIRWPHSLMHLEYTLRIYATLHDWDVSSKLLSSLH